MRCVRYVEPKSDGEVGRLPTGDPRTSSFAQPEVAHKEYTASLLRKAHHGHPGGKTADYPSAACAKLEQNFLRISSRSMPQKEVALRKNREVLQAILPCPSRMLSQCTPQLSATTLEWG